MSLPSALGAIRKTQPGNALRKILVLLALTTVSGCTYMEKAKPKMDLGVAPTDSPLAGSALYRDTIGAYTYYDGLRSMRVRGYGLVVGLGKNGSRDCPRRIYTRLVQRMYKRLSFRSEEIGQKSTSPEAMIDSLDSAVVLVEALIPPASVHGARFDVTVRAVPGTQTRSLRGGRLFFTELEVFRAVSAKTAITGQVLARANGPLFLNPFSDEDAATESDPLSASVIGGGVATKERRLRLVLLEASYQRSRQIQDRINDRFPGPRKTADATSPSFVRLRVPDEYAHDSAHFLSLVRALYLSRDPVFEGTQVRKLAAELVKPNANHIQASMAFEALGRASLPVVDELYFHPSEEVSFYAAAAGLRLEDHIAADAMAKHAEDPTCPKRFQAIRALIQSQGMGGAAMTLRKLLHNDDPRVQIAAYEGLVERGDVTVQSGRVGADNFFLDEIDGDGPRFVYVKRSGSRRIVLFGRDIKCTPPVLYRSPDGSVTINAVSGDDHLTVLRTVVAKGVVSPPIPAPTALAGLLRLLGSEADVDNDGRVTGLGLDYGAITRALHRMCEDQSVNAQFMLEQPNAAELFGPAKSAGRPESEL